MDPIYVTGHRNPDTDSIVAAISYAALRNACGDREYEAACLGRVSDETQIVLDRFGFLPPKRITDLYNQVRDLDFDKPPILSGGVTMGRAWDEFQAYPAIASIPVVNEDGTLYGILSRTDIADYNMSRTNSGVLEEVPLFNAISVLEGKILNDAGESTDTISGEVTIALPQSRENLLFHSRESIVLCGNQPDMIRRALELNVSCLVLCQAEISEELRTMPTETCIISTPYDAFRAARLIFQSVPVERICNTQNVVSFHLDDRVDTVRDMVLKYRHPSYPILDGNEKVVGILTRYHLLRPRRKQVVLVDHNDLIRDDAGERRPGLDHRALHQNAVGHVGPLLHHHAAGEDGVFHRALDKTAVCHQGVGGLGIRAVVSGGVGLVFGADGTSGIEQVGPDRGIQQIHGALEIALHRLEAAHIALMDIGQHDQRFQPGLKDALGEAGHIMGRTILYQLHQQVFGQDIGL